MKCISKFLMQNRIHKIKSAQGQEELQCIPKYIKYSKRPNLKGRLPTR